MKQSTSRFQFQAKVWKYEGKGGWHFVSLPLTLSKKIRDVHGTFEEGWGRLKVQAKIGKSEWDTAIWYDTQARGYLLPLRADIRKKQKVREGDRVAVLLEFEFDPKLEKILSGFKSK